MKAKKTVIPKALFVATIKAIERQVKHDMQVATKLGKAFPNAMPANLLPDNKLITNALFRLLKELMNDNENNWIEHYCYELDFGRENWRLKVYDNGKEIPLSNAGKLYNFLIK